MELLKFIFGEYSAENNPLYQQTHFNRETLFDCYTPEGFVVPCKAFYLIDKINDAEFAAHGMHEERNRDRMIEEYEDEILIPYLQKNGYFTFFLNKINARGRTMYPPLARYMKYSADGGEEFDPNFITSRSEIQKIEYKKKGCSLQMFNVSIYLEDIESVIMENFNKLDWNQHNAIMANPRYREYENWLVIIAQAKRLQLARILLDGQCFQMHRLAAYEVSTEGIDDNIMLKWKFGTLTNKYLRWNLLGFRKTSGFALNKWSESENGTLIVDANAGGSVINHLVAGETYYYTFFLKQGDEKAECLRFSLRVPTEKENESVYRMLEIFKNGGKETSAHFAETSKILNEVEGEQAQKECLRKYREAKAEKIRNRNLPQEEEEMELADLDDSIRTALARHNL